MKSTNVLSLAAAAGGLLLAGAAFAAPAQPAAARAAATVARKGLPRTVDIDNASTAELMKLPGAERCRRAARSCRTKAQLLTHKVISEARYEAGKSSIPARQPGVPPPASAGKR